eukprot:CAMPEP_0172383158 /NCGR_PEP_ID=MMETSP1061-20121228/1080_1 /TAXON_ID=37318 /ORGANISM="Pseudo-nitzschia pungens, Strain cf. pungens" /LENGTH=137 /DNA_ID=CAMNT_0013111309 /DNA_START=227 /DNA_END=640 /DNA_ORIENTATION=-
MLFRSLLFIAALFNLADAFVVSGNGRQQSTCLMASSPETSSPETLRKKEFVAKMAEELGYTKTDAEQALNCVLGLVSDTLADGNKVNFPGFGTFEPRYRKARRGRNPRTGEDIEIAASCGAGFSAAKALKDKLNGRA